MVGPGGDLKIDISDELACIVDLEIRYQYSKLEVERALVACEGDLVKAEEALIRSQKQKPLMPPKPEEASDPPTVGSSSTNLKLKRDEKASNYSKVTAVANPSIDHGNRAAQTLHRYKKKLDSVKPPPVVAVSTDKRLPGAVSNPSSSNSAQYEAVGNQLKNLRLGSLREHVVPKRQPQSINAKQIPTPSVSSSSRPPETSAGWFLDSIGSMNPNPNSVGKSELYSQPHYQQQQFVSNSGLLESLGTNRGNNLWNMTTRPQSHSLPDDSSPGLYYAVSTDAPSVSLSFLEWMPGYSVPQINYNKVDWRLDGPAPSSISDGIWSTMNFFMQINNPCTFDSFAFGLGS